jgi:hypothetical protein
MNAPSTATPPISQARSGVCAARHRTPGDRGRDGGERGADRERAVPAERVVRESGDDRAERLPGDDREQHPADHHLAVLQIEAVADVGDDERDQAAGEDACRDARRDQEREALRERAEDERRRQPADADLDAARLAEAVADRAEERLGERVRQRVGGVEHRRGRRRDREMRSDGQHDRIGEAQCEAAREGARGEDEEDRHLQVLTCRQASRISASISAAATGTPRLIISQPSAVTTASSSMRMPMFQ